MDQIIVLLDPPLLLHNIASLWKYVWKFITKLFQDHQTNWDL